MRTDYKIGIAVGLFLILLVVVYFVWFGPSTGTKPPEKSDEVAVRDKDSEEIFNVTESPRLGQPGRGSPTGPERTADDIGTKGESTFVDVKLKPLRDDESLPGAGGSYTPSELASAADDERFAKLRPLTAAGREPLKRVDPAERGMLIDPALRTSADAGTGGVYVVKEGDNGFWDVAEAVYGEGKGKHWPLIRDANPNADSSLLRAGQRLRYPPLPRKTEPLVEGATEGAGGLVEPVAGMKTYVVEAGDAGFWGIAKKVYRHGKHWHHIANANPGVDSRKLRVGQKILYPAELPKRSGLVDRLGPPGPAAGAGEAAGTYTVRKGDQGFWGVAVKVYKDGTLWPAIAEANPRVKSDSLRAGQVLKVPSLADARAAVKPAGVRTGERGARDKPAPMRYDSRPIFD